MNQLSLRFFAAVPALGLMCSAALAATPQPKLRLSEVEDIAPAAYRADLSLDPAKPEFTGTIEIRINVAKPVSTIWLNANRITVRDASVISGGKTLTAKALPGGDDFIGLDLPSPAPVGPAVIRISYSGSVRQGDTSGVFKVDDTGNSYILTQFESTDARDAFPCFDEPSYKTPWQLTLHVPAGEKAVSNTPVISDTVAGAVRTYVFKETKPLPSYLVAFGVGPFEFVDGGVAGRNHFPVRIVTPKGRANEAKYAAEVTATILTRLEDYFGIPFPYEKSDQVAVPVTIGFGAMENAGMVTYGQTMILSKPESDTINRQREYASVAAHELAHQWFGDLVTTKWWNDIWLNEAFATWMEQKLVAEWKPEWNTRLQDVGTKLGAEDEDSLATARRIRQAIESKDDISNAFDDITYSKGAAVIAMFENWLGQDVFRKGVHLYLDRFAFGNATATDFLTALSEASGKDVSKAFSTFLDQAGVPLVSVAMECKGSATALHMEQKRFLPLGSKGSANQVWSIPVCVRYGSAAQQTECTLMTQAKTDWTLRAASCPAWLDANAAAKGYYLVDYAGGMLPKLTGGDVDARLPANERLDLIGNAQALTDAGKLPAADALGLVETFHSDASRQVVQRALGVALSPRQNEVPAALIPNYQRFLLRNFQARARAIGWVPKAGESDDVRLLRPTLLGAVSTVGGDKELADEARELAVEWLANRSAVKPEVVGEVLATAAYYGDLALFNRFLAEFKKSQDRQEQQRLMSAMRSFRDKAAIEAGMQAVLSGSVTLANGFPLLFSGQNDNSTHKMAFEFVKAHFDQIMAGHPSVFGNDFGSFLPNVGGSFCDAQSRNELQAFFGPRVAQYPGAPRTLAQILESIDLCIARKAALEPGVKTFLEKY